MTLQEVHDRLNDVWEILEEHFAGVWRVRGWTAAGFFSNDYYVVLERWSHRVGKTARFGFGVTELMLEYWRPRAIIAVADMFLEEFEDEETDELFRIPAPLDDGEVWAGKEKV